MSFPGESNRIRGKAAGVVLLAIVVLLACQAMAGAKPLGTFQNLTLSDKDDTMPDMKVDMNDAAHIVYQAYDGTDNDIYYETNTSGAWVTTRITDDSLNDIYPRLELDSDNRPHVTWAHWDGSDYEICYATNAGGSWVNSAVTNNSVDDNRPSIDMEPSDTLNAVSVASASTAWAVGDKGLILRTADGGTTWSRQTWGSGGSASLNGVFAVSASTVWAVGDGGLIIKTTDSGNTWSSQTSGTSSNLFDITADSADTAWAVGAGGTILSTTSGGSTWSTQASPVAGDILAVANYGTDTAWVAGNGGITAYTSNGGGLWTTQDSGVTTALTGISAVDANTAWTVGEGGVILFTGDSGANWDPQDSGTETTFNHVSAVSATQACAVGTSGTIFQTEDGGTNWSEQDSGCRTSLSGIDGIGADNAWAVGVDAMILHAADGEGNWAKQDSRAPGDVWIAFESYDTTDKRSTIQNCSNTGGTWHMLGEVELTVAVKSPSIAVSNDGQWGHMAFVAQDDNNWRVFYECFNAQTGGEGRPVVVSSELQNQLSPSLQLVNDMPVIAFQGRSISGGNANYDIYLSTLDTEVFSTSRLTETRDDEYEPVFNYNPSGNSFCLSYQGYTSEKDFYPGLLRLDSGEDTWLNDSYTELTSKVASRAVAIYANDAYNVHLCYAGQDPDLDVYYGYLAPSPWVYSVGPDKSYPPISSRQGAGGFPGESFTICGTDLGNNGTVYMHVLVETSPGNWEDQELPARVDTWSPTSIRLAAPRYNDFDRQPTDGSIRVRAYGKDSNTDLQFHPL